MSTTFKSNVQDETVNNNLTVDTDTLFVDAANNAVGMGTLTPTSGHRLDVRGKSLYSDILGLPKIATGSLPTASSYQGYIVYDSTTNTFKFSNGTSWIEPPAAMAIGSSVTSGTTGSVLFVGSGPILQQNNSKLFWDNTNNRLGVGTASPAVALHISGTDGSGNGIVTRVTNTDTSTASYATFSLRVGAGSSGGEFFGSSAANDGFGIVNGITMRAGTSTQDVGFSVGTALSGTATGAALIIKSDGKVGIAKNAPTEILDVVGNVRFSGALMPNNTAGTTGQYLTSAGAGAVPTWTTPGSLTIGTSSATSGTVGSILFVATGPIVQQSNSQLFWDNTNNRLGLGTASPSQGQLWIQKSNAGGLGGDVWITNSGSNTIGSTARLSFGADGSTDATPNVGIENIVTNVASSLSDLAIKIFDGSAYNEKMRITSAGSLGVGVTNPTWAFESSINSAGNATVKTKNTSTTGYAGFYAFDSTGAQGEVGLGYGNSGVAAPLANTAYLYHNTNFIFTGSAGQEGTIITGVGTLNWTGAIAANYTPVNNDTMGISVTPTFTKNTGTTVQLQLVQIKPVFNFGGSDSNTTVDLLQIDSTNTSVTGLTANLINASYGGSSKFKLVSTGEIQLGGSAGTAGQAILSNGSGAAATWGSPAATITVGTSTATSGTVGSVLFVGTGPVIQQSNTKFFWDNTNNALAVGLGSISSGYKMDVDGGIRINIGGYGSQGTAANFSSINNFNNFGGTYNGSVVMSSNMYWTGVSSEVATVAQTHSTIAGAAIRIPGAAQTNIGKIEFWTTPSGSVTAGNAYAQSNPRVIIDNSGNLIANIAIAIGQSTVTSGYVLDATGTLRSGNAGFGSVSNGSVKNFANFGGTSDGLFIAGSNVYNDGNTAGTSLKVANTHSNMAGAAIVIPGNGQTRQNNIEFWTTPTASVTAGNGYNQSNPVGFINTKGLLSWSANSITSPANNDIATISQTPTFNRNTAGAIQLYVEQIKPTFNFGGSNTATTVDILSIDSTNTSTTGLTANLINASFGGTSRFKVASNGEIQFNSSAGTSGQVLTSAGTGAPPTWSAVTATIAIGNTVTSGTTGSILFVGTGPVLSQNNSGLFWDNTNNRLGVGTASPPQGTMWVTKSNAGGLGGDFWIANGGTNTVGSIARIAFGADGTTDATPNAGIENIVTNVASFLSDLVFKFYDGSGYNEKMRITSAGVVSTNSSLGVGVTPSFPLHVNAATNAKAYLAAGFSSSVPSLTVDNPSGKVANLLVGSGGSGITYDSTGDFSIKSDAAATLRAGTSGNSGTVRIGITSGGDFYSGGTAGNNLYCDNTNNRVGIGTASPTFGIDLRYPSSGNNAMRVANTNSAGYSSIAFHDNTPTEKSVFGYANASAGNAALAGFSYLYSSTKFVWYWGLTGGNASVGDIDQQGLFSWYGDTAAAPATGRVYTIFEQPTLTKNTNTTVQYYVHRIKPTFNFGASDANTTVDLLSVDSTNTSTTGLTANLLNLSFGGTSKFKVSSGAEIQIAGSSGSAGQALLSNGPGAAASWGNPAAGITVGTTATTSGTVGSVLFVGTGPVLQQNNSNLFWDNTNARFGIQTATPSVPLDVTGTITSNPMVRFKNLHSDGISGVEFYNYTGSQVGWFGARNIGGGTTHSGTIQVSCSNGFWVNDVFNVGSNNSLIGVGTTVQTDADQTITGLDLRSSFLKNDSNTRQFFVQKIKPSFSFGGTNANTTVDILTIDSTNSNVTGLTTNLINVAYGGTSRLKIVSTGEVQFNGSAGTSGQVLTSGGTGAPPTWTTAGVTTVGSFGSTPNSGGASISGLTITLQPADGSNPGGVSTTTQTFAGNKTFSGTISASNLSGTNTGDVTLAAVGASPNANAASLSGQALTLQPADGTHPGVLTAGTQTIGGAKTFSGAISASNLSGTNTGDQTITLTGDVTGSGTGSFAATIATTIPNAHTFSGDITFNSGPNTYKATSGITAFATGGQASATALTAEVNFVDTVATAADSVKLPAAALGKHVVVFNNGANAMDIFPVTGGQIDAQGTNNAYSLAAGASREFWGYSSTDWKSR